MGQLNVNSASDGPQPSEASNHDRSKMEQLQFHSGVFEKRCYILGLFVSPRMS